MFVSLFTAFLQARCDIGDMLDVTSGGGEFRELVSSSFALSISRPLRQNICRSHTLSLSLSRIPSHTLFQRSCVPFFPLLFCLPFQIAGLSAEGLANCDSSFAVELGPLVDTKYRYGRERLAHVAVRCCTEKKKKKLRKKLRNNTTLHCPWMRPLNGPHFKARFSACGLSFLPFFFFFLGTL